MTRALYIKQGIKSSVSCLSRLTLKFQFIIRIALLKDLKPKQNRKNKFEQYLDHAP